MAGKSAILSIRIVSDAKDAQKGFDNTASAADKWQRNLKRAALVAGAAVAGFAVKTAKTFEEVRRTLQVGTGATGAALDALVESTKNIGRVVPEQFEVIADSLATLNTLTGATGTELERLGTQVLNASRLLGEDAAGASVAFGEALKQWGVSAADGAKSLDFLYTLTQDYGVSLTGLSDDLTKHGAALQNVGFTMEETADLFARLSSAGLDVSRIMPGLSRAFRDWAADGKNVQDELNKTVEAVKNASDGTEALAIAAEVFGSRGAQQMVTAIRSGTFALDDLGLGAAAAGGAIDAAAEQNRTLSETFTLLQNNAMAAIEPIASGLLDALVPAMKSFAGLVSENTTLFTVLAGVILALAAGIAVVKVATAAWTSIQTVATVAQWAWNAAMAANPIGAVVAIVIALVAAVILAYQKSETFRNIVDAAGRMAAAAFGWVVDAVTKLFGWIGDLIGKAGGIGNIFSTTMTIAKTAVNWLLTPIRTVINLVSSLIGWISRIRFPEPPGWMKSIGGALGFDAYGDHSTLLGVPSSLPDPTMLTAGRVEPFAAAAFAGMGGISSGRSTVNNYVTEIRVDGSGIVDPQRVASAVKNAISRNARTRGNVPAVIL